VRAKNSSGETYANVGTWWNFTTWKPTAGTWTTSLGDTFQVDASGNYVFDFDYTYLISGCTYQFINLMLPIADAQFSQSGSIYISGTFDSETTAHGTQGLANFYAGGCYGGSSAGYVSVGPYNWTATWSHA